MKKYLIIFVSFFIGLGLGLFIDVLPELFDFSDAVCLDGSQPDKNGCCDGELYTDMGDLGYNCCPEVGGDCFPPIK